jgi:hypothetical protein
MKATETTFKIGEKLGVITAQLSRTDVLTAVLAFAPPDHQLVQ